MSNRDNIVTIMTSIQHSDITSTEQAASALPTKTNMAKDCPQVNVTDHRLL